MERRQFLKNALGAAFFATLPLPVVKALTTESAVLKKADEIGFLSQGLFLFYEDFLVLESDNSFVGFRRDVMQYDLEPAIIGQKTIIISTKSNRFIEYTPGTLFRAVAVDSNYKITTEVYCEEIIYNSVDSMWEYYFTGSGPTQLILKRGDEKIIKNL